MKVKLKPRAKHFGLTPGNVYRVIGIEADDFRIMDDQGMPALYPPRLFQVVDDTPDSDWCVEKGDAGEIYAYAPELAPAGFFEAWWDGEQRAQMILRAHLYRLASAEYQPKRATRKRLAKRHP